LGDHEISCAIVGGIVTRATEHNAIAGKWLQVRESLLEWSLDMQTDGATWAARGVTSRASPAT
jgi:hypothetical protein